MAVNGRNEEKAKPRLDRMNGDAEVRCNGAINGGFRFGHGVYMAD